jgi:hypothetical protein
MGVEPGTEEYNRIVNFLHNTHAKTHDQYDLTVEGIFKVEGKDKNKDPSEQKRRGTLLWHASRLSNYRNIIPNGLILLSLDLPRTRHMFGPGIYFTDVSSKAAELTRKTPTGIYFTDISSKAANYCRTDNENLIGIMALCNVKLGEM